ncbi:MAG: indole-3-glycerol-phosphate synthase [Nitrososphaerales archaeon]
MKTLNELAQDAIATVESDYYGIAKIDKLLSNEGMTLGAVERLVDAIKDKKGKAIICEVKFSSPSAGEIRNRGSASEIAKEMENGGAVALSVLTEPKNFGGSMSNLISVRKQTSLPIIMKDIIVSKEQITAAKQAGASAVLFIEEIFSDGLTKDDLSLDDAVKSAHELGLDTIIETHTIEGLNKISKTSCEIIGINNRNLRTFETDVDTTPKLLKEFSQRNSIHGHLLMAESGFESADDLKRVKSRLQLDKSPQPDAFLIGTSIMRSVNIESKVRGFVEALSNS